MTLKQYDTLYLQLQKLTSEVSLLSAQLGVLNNIVKELSQKTLVVTSLDSDVEKLKIDVQSLIDEKEA